MLQYTLLGCGDAVDAGGDQMIMTEMFTMITAMAVMMLTMVMSMTVLGVISDPCFRPRYGAFGTSMLPLAMPTCP